MIQLKTRWAADVDSMHVHEEYPRPNLVRDSYFNLNGTWDYCINQSVKAEQYDGTILVPFSPETWLSGVQKLVKPKDFLHYRKVFVLPEHVWRTAEDRQSKRVILHFGAVDQECIVSINGTKVGTHKGGYLAFSFDVTEVLREGENELTLCVRDMTEEKPHARGKQKLVPKGLISSIFYTPQSGIWKTVWMECVPKEYVERVKLTPVYDEGAVTVRVITKGTYSRTARVKILDENNVIQEIELPVNQDTKIDLGEFTPWSPDNPHLYDVEVQYGDDCVRSYFGMRKFHTAKDSKGILRFFMNNKPFIFNGILDQGYWPEGLMTPPTDEALKYDIVKLKDLGYNTIRKHIKVEWERFYYHCDKLGMIVWQDMPNGGGDYCLPFVAYLTNVFDWFGRVVKDNHYWIFKRTDEEGRKQYYRDLKGMIEQLYNYPSIAAWVPFNEGWGQFDAKKATEIVRNMDQTRLINEACGWFDQGGGDMYSIHNYSKGLKVKPQKDRVVALTEFGGYAYAIPGHLAREKEFGYKAYKSKEELTANYRRLWEEEVYPNLKHGLSTTIYTQTSDIEEEINGIFTYDRENVKFIEDDLREMNAKLYRMWNEII